MGLGPRELGYRAGLSERLEEVKKLESQLTAANEEIERLTKDRDMWLADDAKQNNSVGRLTAQLTVANVKVVESRKVVKFFADMGWEYAKQALADMEEK